MTKPKSSKNIKVKRILQISNYYYPHIGGIEQVTRDIAQSISSDGMYEQRVICFNENAQDGDEICIRGETVTEFVDGVEVTRCGCITKKASQSISLTFGKKLKDVLDGFNPDIIIFHYPNPFQALFLLRHLKNEDARLILYWHLDIVKQKRLAKFFHGQTMRLLEKADAVIATSPPYIDGSPYLSKFRDKCKVIANCIREKRLTRTSETREITKRLREENEGRVICFGVGRHIPYKGFEYLIEASKLLDDRFVIYIGGQGDLTEGLMRAARNDKKIKFPGRLREEELIAYFDAMDIFCFPSITKNEAFGIALAEGMYFGKPAITFNIPGSGVNYVSVNNKTGLEVPNRDSAAYAEAMLRLADDTELREVLGTEAKKRVEKLFLSDTFKNDILKIIKGM